MSKAIAWLKCWLGFHVWIDGSFQHCDDMARHEVDVCIQCRILRLSGVLR